MTASCTSARHGNWMLCAVRPPICRRERQRRPRLADPALGGGRTVRRACLKPGSDLAMDLWVDTSSVECYLNGGETVLSTRYYPASRDIRVEVRGMKAQYCTMKPMELS